MVLISSSNNHRSIGLSEQKFSDANSNHPGLWLSMSCGAFVQLETELADDPKEYLESFLYNKWQFLEKALSFSSEME